MAEDDRHPIAPLTNEEMGLPPDRPEASALLAHLRDAILLRRLLRRSAIPAILTGILLLAWLVFELEKPRTVGGAPHPAGLLLAGASDHALLAAEPWRLLAAILLHAGAAHFLVNAAGTWFLSQMSDNVLGWARTIVIFVAGGAASFVASALASDTPSVGASGSVYALLGGLVATAVANRHRLPKAPWRWLAGFGVLWVVLSVAFALNTRTTDGAAHLGGFVAGAVLALALGRDLPFFAPDPGPTPRPLAAGAALCLAALAVSFVLSVWGETLHADLPDPVLRHVSFPGLRLPLPSRWEFGRMRDHRCVPDPAASLPDLAADGPLCAQDPYGSVLVLGRAAEVVPGVLLDSSMTAEHGLRVFMGNPEGDVSRRWLVLDHRWALAFNSYSLLAGKYDGMLASMLDGMRLVPDDRSAPPEAPVRAGPRPGR